MDYFTVSISEYPQVSFEDGMGNFYDSLGNFLYGIEPPHHYIRKDYLLSRESWMIPEVKIVDVKRIYSPIDFLELFTVQERITIRLTAPQSPILNDFLELLAIAHEVSLDHPPTIAGVNFLESAGLIATGRAAQILGI